MRRRLPLLARLRRRLFGNPVPPLKIGCDPEFTVLNEEAQMVVGASVIYRGGCLNRPEGNAGTDGTLGELRPSPSTSPRKVVENLQTLIREVVGGLMYRKTSSLRLKGGGGSYSNLYNHYPSPESFYNTGGHLHFDAEDLKMGDLSLFGKALYTYLVPAVYLLAGEDAFRRAKGYYSTGFGRAFCRKNHPPEHNTWEFRLLPSFLENPTLSVFVLGLAHLLWQEVIRYPRRMAARVRRIKDEAPSNSYANGPSRAFILPYPLPEAGYENFRYGLRKWWKGKEEDIKKMTGWKKYEKEFKEVFQLIREEKGYSPYFQGW